MGKLLRFVARRGIAAKLALMAVASVFFMALVAVTVLSIARTQFVTERVEKAHAIVDAAWSIADTFHRQADSGAMTDAEAKARFFAAAAAILFEGHSNYVFIFDTETGIHLVNGGNPTLVGKDVRGMKDANGSPFGIRMMDIVKQQQEGTLRYAFQKGTNPTPLDKIAYVRGFEPWHLMIGSAEYMMDIDASFAGMARTAIGLIAVLMLASIALAWVLVHRVVRPLDGLRLRMNELSAGDLDSPVPAAHRQDELGEMAQAVLRFKDHMVQETRRAAEQQAERQRVEAAQRRAALAGMAETVEAETGAAIQGIGARTAAMTASAEAMAASANRTGASAQTAAGAAGQALANAQAVAGAAEELAASIREIGGQMAQSTTVVGRAVAAGKEARTTIEALNQKVEQIGAVADMISEIAGRTNLLALNATIEAARAGDAGKGFAVVASEVKALASQTARSTQEIAQHIDQVRTATGASVSAMARIEQTITEINEIAASIAGAVQQQGAATAEIARAVAQTADAANEMTERTGEVSTEAVDTGQHAVELRDNIVALKQGVEELKHSIIRVVRTTTSDVDRPQTASRG